MIKRLQDRLLRSTKVEIVCPHGAFIPGNFRTWRRRTQRYGCEPCGLSVRLTPRRGPADW